jgi:hypothetical protein
MREGDIEYARYIGATGHHGEVMQNEIDTSISVP